MAEALGEVKYRGTRVPFETYARAANGSYHAVVVTTAGEVLRLPEAIGVWLLKEEPNYWEAGSGWVPPAETIVEEPVMTLIQAFTLGGRARFVFCNTQGGGFTCSVPIASEFKGQKYDIANTATNSNLVKVLSLGGQIRAPNLAPSSSIELGKSQPYNSISLVSDGSNWNVV